FANTRLKRIDLQSGAVRDLATIVTGRGGSWSTNGVILFSSDVTGQIYRIPAEGGTPEPATALPKDSLDVITHRLPYFLPDGKTFLFSEGSLKGPEGTVQVGRLGSTERHLLLPFPSNVAYGAGRILYVRDGLLMAQRFDPAKTELQGTAVSLIPGLETWTFRFLGNFSISAANDLLVYQPAPVSRARVSWFDPRSNTVTPLLEPGPFRLVRVSPKGDRILVERGDRENSRTDVWLYEPAGNAWSRITSRPSVYYEFSWSPDGQRIGYSGAGDTTASIVTLDRSSTFEFSVQGQNVDPLLDWSPDGSYFVGWQQVGTTGFDLVTTRLTDHPESRLLYSTPANEESPRLSPDGKLLAYISDQSGRPEVYLTRMPEAKAHWQVSTMGAGLLAGFRSGLAWGRNGRELYFLDGAGGLMSVTINDQAGIQIARPVAYRGAPGSIISFDTAPDGRLILVSDEATGQAPLALIEHWPALLEAAH
ncbi:MAG TPA: hypothetical protein VFU03_01370, partial [Gemmatimonadales bacterium]|nr:hypothetical protein [Gemmatimonadales bacterium]